MGHYVFRSSGISVGTQLPYKLEADGDLICRKRFSLAQAFTPGCVRTASGSDRIRNSPRIKKGNLAEKDYSSRAEMNFALFLIRSLPLAVLTHPLNTWTSENHAMN